jgi:hypothetical protein
MGTARPKSLSAPGIASPAQILGSGRAIKRMATAIAGLHRRTRMYSSILTISTSAKYRTSSGKGLFKAIASNLITRIETNRTC